MVDWYAYDWTSIYRVNAWWFCTILIIIIIIIIIIIN